MDWSTIAGAALYGAVGGGLGMLVAVWINKKFEKPIIAVVAFVLILMISINMPRFLDGPELQVSKTGEELVDEVIKGNSPFAIVFADYPELRSDYRRQLLEAYEEGGLTQLTNAAALMGQQLGQTYFREYIAFSDDTVVLAMVDDFIESTKFIAETNPVVCFHWMHSGMPDLGEWMNFPADISDRQGSTLTDVLASGQKNRELGTLDKLKKLSDEEFAAIVTEVMARLTNYIPEAQLFIEGATNPTIVSTDIEKIKTCWTSLAIWSSIADLPTETAAAYVRRIFGG